MGYRKAIGQSGMSSLLIPYLGYVAARSIGVAFPILYDMVVDGAARQ